jgi:hypothetical protein
MLGLAGLLAAAAVACGSASASGPGSGEGSGPASAPAPSRAAAPALPSVSPPPVGATPVVTDPAALTLPIQSYMPTDAELVLLARAQATLEERCMAAAGYHYVSPAPATAPTDAVSGMTDLRYGIHDAASARTDGYLPPSRNAAQDAAKGAAIRAANQAPPRLSAAEQHALYGTAPGASPSTGRSAGPVRAGGCIGQSQNALTGGAPVIADLSQKVNNESYALSLHDPRVEKAFAAWSSCMGTAGYLYATPNDAVNHQSFSRSGPSALQKATAVADVRCKQAHNVIGVWYAVDVAYQRSLIHASAAQFAAIARRDAAEVTAAQAVTG